MQQCCNKNPIASDHWQVRLKETKSRVATRQCLLDVHWTLSIASRWLENWNEAIVYDAFDRDLLLL